MEPDERMLFWYVYPESKKSKSTGRPSKAAVPSQVPDSVFVHMLRESGVTLRLGNMSNEIGMFLNVDVVCGTLGPGIHKH